MSCHEVGLAVDLGEGERLAVGGRREGDDALLRLLVDALRRNSEALLAEILHRLFHVAVRGDERFLARAHAGGRGLAEFLDLLD